MILLTYKDIRDNLPKIWKHNFYLLKEENDQWDNDLAEKAYNELVKCKNLTKKKALEIITPASSFTNIRPDVWVNYICSFCHKHCSKVYCREKNILDICKNNITCICLECVKDCKAKS